MTLQDKRWKKVYRSGDQNLLTEFYMPVLASATQYDRAVGYFSSEVLLMNLQGVASLITNGGKMRLIIGHPLDEDEFLAVKQGHELNRILDDLNRKLDDIIEESRKRPINRLDLLSWLIAADKLEIKFALRRKGMYHEKIGIVHDHDKNIVAFQGSANETTFALDEGFNAESIMVFTSWNQPTFDEYGLPCIRGFEDLWHGEQKNTVTLSVPSEFYEKIANACTSENPPDNSFESATERVYEEFFSDDSHDFHPRIPEYLGGNPFGIFDHQKQAINLWQSNHFKGILKLATGSGKTITSLYAATKLFEARKRKGLKLVLIVAVPYQQLAKQWVSSFNAFNVRPVQCWDSKFKWWDDLKSDILAFNMNAIEFIGIVVVNRTLEGDAFQELIGLVNENEIMVIGDECHNHGSEKTNKALPNAYYRLGLSATPFRSDEDEIDSPFPNTAKERILKYYGPIVSEYGLGDAIHDGVLCEYDYHIIPVHLTQLEQEKYEELSSEIGRLVVIQRNSGLSVAQKGRLTALCGQRSRLLGGAQNKLVALSDVLSEIPANAKKHSLFYCGEGIADPDLMDIDMGDERIINSVSKVLHEHDWKSSRFTSLENAGQRTSIMNNFVNGDIDALVSMRVLDEGIDVPVCDKAFILASTKNPRQYVQRRGRVLRTANNKTKAVIYDFVTLPNAGAVNSASRRLKESELERVDDFCMLATNKLQIEQTVNELRLRND